MTGFPHTSFQLAMDSKRRRHSKFLVNYIYSMMICSSLFIVTFFVLAIYFRFDPMPHFIKPFEISPSTPYMLAFRFVILIGVVYEAQRYSVEYNILTISLFQCYDVTLTLLGKISSENNLFQYYRMLQICHSAISPYTDAMYFATFFNCQINIVMNLWLTIRTLGPLMLYLWFPMIALSYCGMVVIMTRIMGGSVHNWSKRLLFKWRCKANSMPVTKELRAKTGLSFSCGPQMKIKRSTALTFLNTVLNNWGTAVLLI